MKNMKPLERAPLSLSLVHVLFLFLYVCVYLSHMSLHWMYYCKFITVNVCAMNLHSCANVPNPVGNISSRSSNNKINKPYISSHFIRKNAQCHIGKSNCLFAVPLHIYAEKIESKRQRHYKSKREKTHITHIHTYKKQNK